MFRTLLLFITLIGCSLNSSAQEIKAEDLERIKKLEDSLKVYSHIILNDSIAENRFAATKLFVPMLVEALKHEHSFNYPFKKLDHISIQYPQDSTFRIFSFTLFVDNDHYRYYGAIQKNSKELQLIPLLDRTEIAQDLEQQVLSNTDWIGSVYYNILDFDTPEGRKYLLFGYDAFSFFNRRKITDVLSFLGDTVQFGAPVFVKKEQDKIVETKNRLIIEYSARAAVKMNYDLVQEAIVFDHLLPYTINPGEPNTWVPDGSYEGYKLVNGQWEYVEKVFCDCPRVDGEAPRPYALDPKDQKDIFGN